LGELLSRRIQGRSGDLESFLAGERTEPASLLERLELPADLRRLVGGARRKKSTGGIPGLGKLVDGLPYPFLFAWCRRTASDAVKAGRITRRDFFRCFTDRPKKPKVAKTAPVRPGGKKARKDVTRNWGAPRTHDKRSKAPVPVEVYVTRRRA
jgi:hypothetical protein